MRSLTLRKTALAAVVPLALGSLAACGNHDSQTAADPQAPSTSTGASSPSSPATTDSGNGAHTLDPAAFLGKLKSAAKSITTARFTMSMDLSGQSITAKGALDMTGDTPAMQVTMDLTGMGTATDMRMVGGVMYIKDPTGSGKYLKLDLSDPNGPLGNMGDALGNYDPQSLIDKLSPDTFRKVTDLGQATIGGQQVEHYRVVLDTHAATQMFKNLPSTASLPRTMTYDLWLDSQDRMARFTMLMKNVSRITATYTDYGADVHISAPPAADVMEMPSSSR
ncbi:MAG TPA: hypothetical protein VGK78_19815 [Nocardioides sp.]|uniref:hypothetical protein n=1 Tax=Nocardioides sp. TaxID=35761 RepID=UPI002F3E83D5